MYFPVFYSSFISTGNQCLSNSKKKSNRCKNLVKSVLLLRMNEKINIMSTTTTVCSGSILPMRATAY